MKNRKEDIKKAIEFLLEEERCITMGFPNYMYPEPPTDEQLIDFFVRWNDFAKHFPEFKMKPYEY